MKQSEVAWERSEILRDFYLLLLILSHGFLRNWNTFVYKISLFVTSKQQSQEPFKIYCSFILLLTKYKTSHKSKIFIFN